MTFATGNQKSGVQYKHAEDLKNEIQKLMFSDNTPMVLSENQARFSMLMSSFQNYEKVVSNKTRWLKMMYQ